MTAPGPARDRASEMVAASASPPGSTVQAVLRYFSYSGHPCHAAAARIAARAQSRSAATMGPRERRPPVAGGPDRAAAAAGATLSRGTRRTGMVGG